MKQLYQENTSCKSTYTLHKNRSFTDSLESYQHGANKELMILRWNKRNPTKEIVLHFLHVFSTEEIKELRTKIFRYLREHNIEAVASIELTKGSNGKPNNCVHFHILTDDQRRETTLRALFITACEHVNLVNGKDFRIDYKPLTNGKRYFGYTTKYDHSDKVILFQPNTGLQKFYKIGKWFRKTKKQIWDDVKAWLQKKSEAEKNEGTIPDNKDQPDWNREQQRNVSPETKPSRTPHQLKWEPADHRKLKQMLDRETDDTLYDWYCILQSQPTQFHTIPPRWLETKLLRLPLKRKALLTAIENRIEKCEYQDFYSEDDQWCPPYFLPRWDYLQNRHKG